jgi:adenylate kinase family enzyme
VKHVLITGMSGAGKSALLDELAARGYRTVDTDYGDYHETVDGEWLWREDRIDALLSEEGAGLLFVQGTTRNQVKFYSRFEHIVLLSAPAEVLVERLTKRTNNPYGNDSAELGGAVAQRTGNARGGDDRADYTGRGYRSRPCASAWDITVG